MSLIADFPHVSSEKQVRVIAPFTTWFTGLSGAGKTTIAQIIDETLRKQGYQVALLDADVVRQGLNKDLGFSSADRTENVRRLAEVARLMMKQGFLVLVACMAPLHYHRQIAKAVIGAHDFFEVFVDTPVEECERRDTKGLYATGSLLPGVDVVYQRPESHIFAVQGMGCDAQSSAEEVIRHMLTRGHLT